MRLVSFFLLACALPAAAQFDPTRDPVSPAGVKATVDLPTSQHMRNVGGSDGAGLCVFTSVQHASRWQNVRTLDGFRDWMQKRPGGGWPEKLDDMLARFCREKGVPVPPYIQHTGGDEAFLDAAMKTDRVVSVTYSGVDDFYRGRVAHMVNLAHLDAVNAAIIDNNRPGVWLWMSRADFLRRWRDMNGGWAVVLLDAPPPPHIQTAFEAFGKGPCVCGDDCKCKSGDCPNKCPTVAGQCPGGRCPLPALPVFPQLSNEPIGNPPSDRHYWGRFPDGVWGWRLKDAVEAPTPQTPYLTGVDSDKIHSEKRYWTFTGGLTEKQAHALLTGAGITDDSHKWHLTAVGDPAFLSAFAADVGKLPADVRGKLLVQSYGPSDWPVAQFRLPVGASLRKPSPARESVELGSVAPGGYSTQSLNDLLSVAGGPVVKPAPIPQPTPQPEPKPNDPTPAPVDPKSPETPGGVWALLGAIAALIVAWLSGRKK